MTYLRQFQDYRNYRRKEKKEPEKFRVDPKVVQSNLEGVPGQEELNNMFYLLIK